MNALDERTAQDLLELVAHAAPAVLAPSDLAERVLAQRRRRRRGRLAVGLGALALTGAVAAGALPDRGDYARFYQPSGSMAPTVAVGQTVVLRKDAVPVRGDVVRITVRNAGVEPFEALRRVIGLPGDVVACPDDGQGRCAGVVVSGETLDEPFLTQATRPFDPVTVGPGQVFVLGDARKAAIDSRHLGAQRLADVKGAAVARVEPDGTLTRLPGTPERPLPSGDDTVDPLGPRQPSLQLHILGG